MIYSNLTAFLLANIPVITAGDSSNNAKLHLVWDPRPSKWIKFPPVQTTVESSKHIHHCSRPRSTRTKKDLHEKFDQRLTETLPHSQH